MLTNQNLKHILHWAKFCEKNGYNWTKWESNLYFKILQEIKNLEHQNYEKLHQARKINSKAQTTLSR